MSLTTTHAARDVTRLAARRLGLLALLAATAMPLALRPLPALAHDSVAAVAQGQITVTGEGQITSAPDMATITLGVTSRAPSAAEALSTNSASLAVVVERLKAAGIEARDLQTSNLSVNPDWFHGENAEPKITGYTASNMLSVVVRDLSKLGGILDQVVAEGANTLNGLNFGIAEPRPQLDAARKLAVADARVRAELLAEAAGVKLGAITAIREGGAHAGMPVAYMRAEAASAVPVEAGEIGHQAQVEITWALLP